ATIMVGAWDGLSIPSDTIGRSGSQWQVVGKARSGAGGSIGLRRSPAAQRHLRVLQSVTHRLKFPSQTLCTAHKTCFLIHRRGACECRPVPSEIAPANFVEAQEDPPRERGAGI